MNRIVKKPEQRRKELILAAQALFLKQDYEHTSMRDIMEVLNIAKGTIYHYFKSKEDLLEAVVENMVDESLGHLKIMIEQKEGNALEKMHALFTASHIADEQAQLLEQLHQPGNIAMHTRLLAITILKIAPLYAEVIQLGCKEGIFNSSHPLETAEFLLAGIQFMTDVGCFPWKKQDLKRRAVAIASVMETQLGAPKGSFKFLTTNMNKDKR